MIGLRERQQGTTGAGRLASRTEGDVNSVLVQRLELMTDATASSAEATRQLLEHLRGGKAKKIRVDKFMSSATPETPTATATKITFPQTWLPAPAVIPTVIYGIGGTANATLQIGRRVYQIQVAASIPSPATLPLAEDTGLLVYPEDPVVLSVPTTAVVLSLELIGYILDPAETEKVIW